MFKIYAQLNGNKKSFDSLKDLRLEINSYGKQLNSLSLEVQDGDKYYKLSLLSACHYVTTGSLYEKEKK